MRFLLSFPCHLPLEVREHEYDLDRAGFEECWDRVARRLSRHPSVSNALPLPGLANGRQFLSLDRDSLARPVELLRFSLSPESLSGMCGVSTGLDSVLCHLFSGVVVVELGVSLAELSSQPFRTDVATAVQEHLDSCAEAVVGSAVGDVVAHLVDVVSDVDADQRFVAVLDRSTADSQSRVGSPPWVSRALVLSNGEPEFESILRAWLVGSTEPGREDGVIDQLRSGAKGYHLLWMNHVVVDRDPTQVTARTRQELEHVWLALAYAQFFFLAMESLDERSRLLRSEVGSAGI